MKQMMMTLAAALAATMMAGPVMADAQSGPSACRPETGDNRVTRWTSQDQSGCAFPHCVVQINRITENSAEVQVDVQHAHDFGGEYDVPPTTPKVVKVAVMGNDAKAGTVVWGKQVGELNGSSNPTDVLQGTRTFTGLKPNAHYVAVLYAPYLGFGNLRPFARYCFRTAASPWMPDPGNRGCFTPYTPTVGGTQQPVNYMACVQARNACNAAPTTTWEQAGNRCIPASN